MASNTDARPSAPDSRPQTTRQLGKYRIEKQLGAGGMGTVFLAVDTQLRRTVALKVLPKERAANPQLVKRFESEGASAAKLEHENIVRVFDSGKIDGYLYLALEYIDGIDVQELVSKRGRLPVRRSIEIVTQVAAALQHAYERSIVHRDIKPSNLLIRKDGVVKLADMGLARAIDESTEAGITHAGMTVGTVDYISPEQGADSKRADIRSDLYSLGCSWYHMLTGEVPYPEGTAADKLRAHNIAPIPDPRRLNDRIPAAIVAVLQRLMAKRPEDRYQTPQELINDLRQPSLLQRETGAADIAGLALAATEASTAAVPSDRHATVADLFDDDDDVHAEDAGDNRSGEERQSVRRSKRTKADPERTEPRRKRKRSASGEDDSSKSPGRSPRPNADGQRPADLPGRAARPDKFAVDTSSIDPDQLKLAGIGLLGLIVFGAVGWAAWQYVATSSDEVVSAGANPFARNAAPESLPAPLPPQPAPKTEKPAEPPPPTISQFKPKSPFPGVADAGSDSSVADAPQWVYEIREKNPVPAQTIVVDPSSPAGPQTAEDAIARLSPSGGIIEFKGRGPHPVASLSISAGQNVVLRAAEGDSPVLVWEGVDQSGGGGITSAGASLEISGLHIVASGRARGALHPLISVDNSTLFIRNCSVTVADPANETTTLVRLAHGNSGPSRCAFENVILRGNNASAALLDGPDQEFVAGNCVFATGDAPAFKLISPATGGADESHVGTSVQMLASVVISRNSAFDCERVPDSPSPTLRLRIRHSAVIGDGAVAATLRFQAWPEAPAGELDRSRALGVSLLSEKSVWSSWPQLTLFQNAAGGRPVVVESEAQWLQFWRFPLVGFDNSPPTTAGQSPDNQTATATSILARATGQGSGQLQPELSLNVGDLPEIPEEFVARLVAISSRPRVPSDLDAPFSGPTVQVDLSNDGLKLNSKLNGPDCPDGATVVLTGSGRKFIEPVSLMGKSLRLEFAAGDSPLIVEPVKKSGANVERPAALFRVEGGRFDLINVHARIPPSERTAYPLRLLEVVNGSFMVRNCLMYGQFGAGSQNTPTIEWRSTGDDAAQFGLIENSLVAGQAQAISALLTGQLLETRNSIIVSNGDCFRLFPASADVASTLHVTSGTLAAAAAIFRIAPPDNAAMPAGRLRTFVDETVYGPPVSSSDGPVLVIQQSQDGPTTRVDWWEQDTAISDRISRFRITGDSQSGTQDFSSVWLRGWGPEHIAGVSYEPLSVLLSVKDIDSSRTQPSDWELDGNSLAASARSDGGPIGADPAAVGPRGSSSGQPASAQEPGKKPQAPRGRRPAF